MTHWKAIQSWEQLKRIMQANPELYVLDTRSKERRFKLVSSDSEIGQSVDGRSIRAAGLRMVDGRRFKL